MPKTVLRKVGGSVMMVVPPAILEDMDIGIGTTLDLSVSEGRLVAETLKPPTYDLTALLAEWEAVGAAEPRDRLWLDSRAVGNELI